MLNLAQIGKEGWAQSTPKCENLVEIALFQLFSLHRSSPVYQSRWNL